MEIFIGATPILVVVFKITGSIIVMIIIIIIIIMMMMMMIILKRYIKNRQ